ncbi:MAG: DUF4349 domain-containing protein [Microbacterium sp.]|uniref:DUF4349 domain-containing protein n=1 Tax=Microbacterium sp. TaxID=51671 RepID=UPI001D98B924|nr:DUF4349 domain-containing protein [Microbacterium sp.]MBW8764590.1 DUF4349 domain-containing protein [Microbacterium sp.]
MHMTRRVLAVLVLASLGAFGLAGCAASSGGGSVQNAGQAPAQDVPAEADPGEPDTAVVITGRISIVAEDPIDAAGAATVIVTDAGGRVSARTEHAAEDGSQASADLTLRIPADALEDVRSELAGLGTVKETTLDSAEVGGTQRDLDARITTLRASIARYNEWLGTASATSDLIELESAIAERQTELEGLEAQARALDDQVAMSTITLSLMSEYVPVKTAPDDFGEALLVGWNGFVAFWSAVLIALGVALPWLVLFAAIAVGATLLTIRARRRQAMRLQPPQPVLDAALFPAPEQMPAPEQVTGPR